jgi:hypothetical protein
MVGDEGQGMSEGQISRFGRMSLRLRHISQSMQRLASGVPRPRMIFIHVPKTAGASTVKYIQHCVGERRPGGQYQIHDNDTRRGYEEDIRRARKVEFAYGHLSWETFEKIRNGRKVFAFTFLRDPLDRLLSNFSFLKVIKRPAHAEKHYPGIAAMTLEEYAASPHPKFRYGMDNFMVRQFAGSLDNYPDKTNRADMLERAKAHLSRLDFIGFTDRYDQDFRRLIVQAGLPQLGLTPRYNVTRQANVHRDSPDISSTVRNLLLDRVRVDMELWDYARARFL